MKIKLIKEQTNPPKIDLKQLRDVYKCPFLIGAEFGQGIMVRVATSDSPQGNYLTGDKLFIKNDYTYDVVRDNKVIAKNKKWICSTLPKDEIKPTLSAKQQKDVNDLINFYNQQGEYLYKKEEPTADEVAKGMWEPVNLKDEKGFKDRIQFDYFVYKKTGLRQTQSPKQKEIIKTFTDQGYKDLGGILNPAEDNKYHQVNLMDLYPNHFKDTYLLVKNIESIDTNTIIKELNKLVKSKNFSDRKTCKQIVNLYKTAKNKEAPINDATLLNWKTAVNMCSKKVRNFLDLGTTKGTINKLNKLDGRWSTDLTKKTNNPTSEPDSTVPSSVETNENYLNLKRIIRENLNELSESKKKSLVEEYNIINLRFNIITESGKPKTKKQKEKFADDIINEIFYLKSQGFNETLINEQFFDILKSFFGQIPGGIFGTLKERFAQFILSKLGLDTEGYLANIFITTIGNIPLGDYANGKIFNCEYISNAISKGVGEGIARKIQKEQGMEGPFYDTVRNAMVDMFTDSKFGDKIEKAVGQMICPSLPKIKERFASAGEAMKEKALS